MPVNHNQLAPLIYRTAHAAVWSAIEIGARYGAQIVVLIVLARLLTPADFGLIAMLMVFVSVGMLLTDAGFGSALIQRQSISSDDEVTVFGFSIVSALFLAAVLWASAESVATFYDQPRLVELTRVLSCVIPLGAAGAVPDALLTIRLDFKARAIAQVIASVLSGAIGIGLALHGAGVWSLVALALAATATRSAMLWVLAQWRPRGSFSITSFRRLFGFGGFMLMAGLLNTISTRVQTVVIGRLFDAGTLGFYNLAESASGAPKGLMASVLGRVGLPVFAQIADDKRRLREALQRAINLSMFLFMPCMVGIAVAARPIIELVYGPRWAPAAPILALLALAGAFWPIHVLNLAALNAQGRSDRFFRLDVFKTLIILVLTLLAARWGAVAVAGAMLAAGLLGTIINSWYTRRMLDYGLVQQLFGQWPTFLLTTLAALPAWGILHWTEPSPIHTTLAIVVAVIVYVGAAAATGCRAWLELRHMARNFLPQDRPNETPST